MFPCRVRIHAPTVDQFKETLSDVSLALVVVHYQGDWAPSLKVASLLRLCSAIGNTIEIISNGLPL